MTGYGFVGPMTAMGTVFSAKAADEGGGEAGVGGGRMMMMGIGSFVWWLLQ